MLPSRCYLSDDFSVVDLDDSVELSPEKLMNAAQIKEWVGNLRTSPKSFATTSIYLLREISLQKIYCLYINIKSDGTQESFCMDDIGTLEILHRELEQCDRYLQH